MKTKEFIKKVEELGYKVGKLDENTLSIDKSFDTHASIGLTETNSIDTRFKYHIPTELFDLIIEYAKTPVAEREEPKKYYLRAKGYASFGGNYFNYRRLSNSWQLDGKLEFNHFQTKFTQEEIDNHQFSDIMKAFEKVEVND